MIIFSVVKEQHGWTIRAGERMTTPFWSRDLAIREANRLAAAIRGHGERTEVVIEDRQTRETTLNRPGQAESLAIGL